MHTYSSWVTSTYMWLLTFSVCEANCRSGVEQISHDRGAELAAPVKELAYGDFFGVETTSSASTARDQKLISCSCQSSMSHTKFSRDLLLRIQHTEA